MSEQRVGDVRPIYRRGDRVLVELWPWFYILMIESWEVIQDELWLHCKIRDSAIAFPASCVMRRLAPGQKFTLSMLR